MCIRDSFNNNAPSYFSKRLIKDALQKLSEADKLDKGIPDVHARTIEYLIKRGTCLCDTEIEFGNQAHKALMKVLEFIPPQSIGSSIGQFVRECELKSQSADTLYADLSEKFSIVRDFDNSYAEISHGIKLIEDRLEGMESIGAVSYTHLDVYKRQIGYSASIQKDWKKRLEDAIRDQKLRVRNREFFCFVCTNATFSSKYVQDQIQKIRGNALLLVDEAHNFGAQNLSNLLSNKFTFRLALSATIDRHNDDEGTARLYGYFGEKCIEYTLERAIDDHKLTKYKYYPITVSYTHLDVYKRQVVICLSK